MATPAVSFEIDAAGLQRAGSRKPRHLALRMSDKKRAASPGSSVESSTEELAGASSSSASQHSHASASQKRQQLLAQRRQHCGERVRHAKSVASKQHSRRERDVKRLRSAIDERQWTTDFRRQALQRVPRSKLMDGDAGQSVAAELIRTRLAAKRIQRWWKVQAVRDVVRQLLAAGVVVADVGKMPIEALMVFIQSESVIQATSRFLLAAKKSTRSLARYRIKNPTKIFLSAFMIVHHPEDMFPEMNDEQKVGREAGALL